MRHKETVFCTFGWGQPNGGHVLPIIADDYNSARAYMFDTYGRAWCTSYTEEQWLAVEAKGPLYAEKRLPTVSVLERYIEGLVLGKYTFWKTHEKKQIAYLLVTATAAQEAAEEAGWERLSPEDFLARYIDTSYDVIKEV